MKKQADTANLGGRVEPTDSNQQVAEALKVASMNKAVKVAKVADSSMQPAEATEIINVTNLNEIVNKLQNHEIVTVPTETVEGYAVLLNSKKAVKALMLKKERDFNSGKVFTLVPESKAAISSYAKLSSLAKLLVQKYFPGELTLILPKNQKFHHFYFDHFEKIGLRIPDHSLFPELLKTVGPLLLTSANPRGGTPKSLTGHLPSTIIDLTGKKPQVLRQGNLMVNF